MNFNNRCNCNNREDYENSNYNERKTCCIRKIEETYCCFPSYYNEDNKNCKKDDKRENYEYPCYEGTFTLWPNKSQCNHKRDNECHKETGCNESNSGHRNKCCFCNLFNCNRW